MPKIIKYDIEKIIKLYKDDWLNIYQIAKIINSNGSTVKDILNRNGISTKPRAKMHPNIIKNILKMYFEDKLSCPKISKIIGVSASTIKQYIVDNGGKLRGWRETSRKYSVNENFFERIDSEKKAYWLGFLYADGCVCNPRKNGYYVVLGLSYKDIKHVEQFKADIESQSPIYLINQGPSKIGNRQIKKSKQSRINICNSKMGLDLIKLGCVPKKSLILRFPSSKQVPDDFIHHFVRGFFDGDGTIYKQRVGKRTQFRIKFLGTPSFLAKLINLIKKNTNIKINNINKEGESKTFAFNIGGNKQILKIYNWMYKDSKTFLHRKRNLFLEAEKQGVCIMESDVNHHYAKEYIFRDIDGNIVKIKNVKLFCRKHPFLEATGLYALQTERWKHYKGWTKYYPNRKWKPVKLLIPPTTGKNYNFEKIL